MRHLSSCCESFKNHLHEKRFESENGLSYRGLLTVLTDGTIGITLPQGKWIEIDFCPWCGVKIDKNSRKLDWQNFITENP